jgi:hypothetical protein
MIEEIAPMLIIFRTIADDLKTINIAHKNVRPGISQAK